MRRVHLIGSGVGEGRRISALLKGVGIAVLLGFAVMSLKSASVASPVLPKIWIGEFFGRITKVEALSARDVIRLQLTTNGHQSLPVNVRVNLTPAQFDEDFQPGAVIRVRARICWLPATANIWR